ncbi:MAG: bifunctional precorrin-2 dehydrogenase/sirohydrochlorin ferrochelatase [Methanobrevibacter sp.]|uniref:precorrin-2 dehydrogenase/sirohydrochlorin ferrochelatase family protein n=1 Tax=Methanobrevibacter sp. TaxID=66852 RepID=UPI0026DEA9DA|nr:bifunctional precorrin-2 dehydrogenase/sirohydrochlorin ferrochelatase [Methanobrevibacter sp.]MDO5848205.1 bifunctional precorrin-2 dehydrogenase/sirohydrochlorin ferrochelatase [Methanobrevibacter sp.]
MNWTSIYLKTENHNVFILGTGEVATRRANKFLDHGANVCLAGNHLDEGLKEKGALLKSTDEVNELVEWADIVIIASGDEELCEYVSEISKDKLLNRADFPDKGNIIVPNSFYVGDIEISIFTGAKSPLISKYLRKKIQSIITEEDIIKIELQDYARKILKKNIDDQKVRKQYLYEIFENPNLEDLIKQRKIEESKIYINKLIAHI